MDKKFTPPPLPRGFAEEERRKFWRRKQDEDLIARLTDERDARQWRPIESVPKDCTWVQLWRHPVEFGSASPIIIARWSDEYETFVWPCDPFDPFTPRGRNLAEDDMAEDNYFEDKNFTHWMPLPVVPVAALTPTKQEAKS